MEQETQPIDLSLCDKEPIHIPGSIQPHGMLLTLGLRNLEVRQVAGNTDAFLAKNASDLLGKPIRDAVGAEVTEALFTIEPAITEPLYFGSIPSAPRQKLDLTAHFSKDVLVIELEPSSQEWQNAEQYQR